MYVQENPANVFVEISADAPFILDPRSGARWPTDVLSLMSTAELANLGVYPYVPFTPPPGTHVVGPPDYRRNGDVIEQIYYEWALDVLPVPSVISDRQFFQALALEGAISQQEALDAVRTGTIPNAMMPYVNALTDSTDKFTALMLLSGAVEFHRDHPLVTAFMEANGWSAQQVDDLWRFAATL